MQTGLIAVELVSKLNQLPVDVRSIAREYSIGPDELTREELQRIFKKLGFHVKPKPFNLKTLQQYPLPAIMQREQGDYEVLLKLDAEKKMGLVFDIEAKGAKEKTWEQLESQSSGTVLVLKPKLISDQVKFGFQWFYKEIIKFKRVILEVILGSFVIQLFGLVTPLFTQVILDKVIVHQSMTTLDVLAVAFIAIMIFEFFLSIGRNYIFNHTANKIDAKLGAKLFKHLFSLPFVYFESRKVGNIVARVRELDTIRDFITNKAVSVIIDVVFSGLYLVIMTIYSVKLTLIVLGFVAFIAFLYFLITPVFRERLETKFQMGAQTNSYLVESITGMQTVKSLAVEGNLQKRWEDHLANYLKSNFKLANMSQISRSVASLLQRGMTLSILFVGVKLVMENQLTIGQLIAFQMFAGQLISPILRLVGLWQEFQQALLAVDRLGDILHHPIEVQSSQAITLPKLNGEVRFDNICFRYQPSSPNVLTNLTFTAPPGTSIGLVGRSGSGKSTITKLIQRLYLAQEGAIYIDGVDVRHMDPLWLRYQIGVVLQENYLFSGTIRENISMGKPDASIEMVIQASQMAGAHEFITQLPEGYDTVVGERGSTLSGGQKQRVAIARALITNPRILIFDEATSALDYESEMIIQKNLSIIKQGRTVFIIAHRLSTVQECDRIYALDKGEIVESGSHVELMGQRGYYYSLNTMQQRELV